MAERLIIKEVPSCRPYAETDYVLITETYLPRAERDLTHAQRYIRKEELRDRVSDIAQITGRAQIGRIGDPRNR